MHSSLIAFLAFTATALAEPVPLFDGRTLDGWEGNTSLWRVEEGEIRGGSLTEKVVRNEFLSTRKAYADFELRVKLRLGGTGFVNSGVQIRSVRVPGSSETCGYQVDYGKGWYGRLYDESRRNKVIAESKDMAAATAAIHEGEWNEYRIRAQGPRIQSWINGVPALDFTETDPAIVQDGQIAIQIHGGGAAQVQVKDVFLEELPQESPLELKIEGAELAPEGFAARAESTLKAWYPRIRHILGTNYDTPVKVTLRFKNMPGVAHTIGSLVEASSGYFKGHPDDVGALVHELVHVIQAYPNGAPGWLVEGIADYVRYYYYEPLRGFTFKPRPGQDYHAGYNPAAALLAKVQVGRPQPIVSTLNTLGHEHKLTEAAFKDITGLTPDAAWEKVGK